MSLPLLARILLHNHAGSLLTRALSFRYNEGISDIKGKVTLEGEPKVVYKSDALGIETIIFTDFEVTYKVRRLTP